MTRPTMFDRYSRQILFPGIGREGQERLGRSTVLIVGCGALGSAQAEALSRAGIGTLRIADRDFVEASNLQRQTMFTESDARERLPKAVACANRIAEINSEVRVQPEVTDVNASNVEALIDGCDLVLDGTDNFGTRYLLNDACVKHNLPWIYGGAVSANGVTMTIIPHRTPCLRCIFAEAPPAGSAPTCDTAGVIMPIISLVVAWQVTEALKLLTGQPETLHGGLMQFDLWRNEHRRIGLAAPDPECPTCGLGQYTSLDAENATQPAMLCGRDAVQISSPAGTQLDLVGLAERLRPLGEVKVNEYLLRFSVDEYELTIFRDARAIIKGVDDIALARSLYARYVGA